MAFFSPPLFVLLFTGFSAVGGGRVLVFPGEYSHWLNMRSIMDELVKRNHSVTVVVSEASPSVNYDDSHLRDKFNFIVFKVPFTRVEMHGLTQDLIHFSMYESHTASLLQKVLVMSDWLRRLTEMLRLQCDAMLKNEQLMAMLREATFDVVLLDPMMLCGDLVADLLRIPLIMSIRFSFGGVLERHCGHALAPPSYVPVPPLPYGDRMTFVERLVNTVTYVWMSAITELMWKLMLSGYYSEIKGSPTGMCTTLGKADIWFIRTFWDIETPRPISPNFVYVGGLHCKAASQLPEEMEAFVGSSGDAGIVIVSFGSMVPNLTMERADVMAAAFAQIPQKVIWRYSGQKPKSLASNTKLYDWIPQNDLLGHSQTKAFITHGGTNGLYEAVFHGVPLVGIPLFGDQHNNLAHLNRRGVAVILDFHTMTSAELMAALWSVINEPTYKLNMQHLSALHRDRPMTPLDTAAFWVEYVMRHGGAPHLRMASHDLNWFQYYSVDVAAALLVSMTTAGALCWWSLKCCLRFCRHQQPREKND